MMTWVEVYRNTYNRIQSWLNGAMWKPLNKPKGEKGRKAQEKALRVIRKLTHLPHPEDVENAIRTLGDVGG